MRIHAVTPVLCLQSTSPPLAKGLHSLPVLCAHADLICTPAGQTLRRSHYGAGQISLLERSAALQHVLEAMLQYHPSARPSAQDLVAQVITAPHQMAC